MKMHLWRPDGTSTLCGIIMLSSSTIFPSRVTCKKCASFWSLNQLWYADKIEESLRSDFAADLETFYEDGVGPTEAAETMLRGPLFRDIFSFLNDPPKSSI